ncbi:MAG: hypothetical protein KJO01_08770 [Gammaproteobacteria bacterium]|nr:hypothetical protein [Gammaproteobacteria bacterium]MBT8109337.1 hypothetical protein [Gammaproteobacteria bacterium]NNL44039.1 hypothetical protein [Woeseiaceae bacterium]
MIKNTSNTRRVMLAVTETSSIHDLWRVAIQHLQGEHAELITVLVRDDRWRRAASLEFTEEISRAGGGSVSFTLQRAEEVDRDAVMRTQDRLQQLAMKAKIQLAFEILAEHEATRLHEFVRSESDLLIVPSFFKGRPFYSELARLKCRILLVDAKDVTAERENYLE